MGIGEESTEKKLKVKAKLMDLRQKMILPVRRVWIAISAHVKSCKNVPRNRT
ncbi:hypothetical protein I3842_09G165500 [Carya illinoinensis]|uniref:Uncharacterized protein n=1 Tax=Carya illinoinensis TaxID=32201 RepID=A0A922E6P1_CARIL|nr:hypothetical protein I3842_09G165500 [Carya illinoinensis]